jgi:sialidase-1
MPDGEVVAFMVRSDRTDHPDEGLANPENLGFVPTELLLLRSKDFGRTWTDPDPIKPPLSGPSFEMCCPIVPLRDGRWVIPTLNWPGWDGVCPDGIKMVGLVSSDCGKSWPRYWTVMRDPVGKVFYWESKIAELPDRRLLAVAWVYDDESKKDRPNHYALSCDGGETWSEPVSMDLQGQTLTPFVLDDGRVLCVYRRMDKPGLWANLARLEGTKWINEKELPLWGHQAQGLTGTSQNMVQNFNVMRFGAPSITRLGDGTLFVAFWCYEDCVSVIRWFKLAVI